MMMTVGSARLVSAVLLVTVALAGCSGQKTETKPATSTQSSAASTSAKTGSSPAAAPAGQKVAPPDLPAVVADRTFRGTEDGVSYAEYYAPDGSLRGKSGGQAYSGSWKVAGEQLCFTYPKPEGNEVDCYAAFKNGDALSWVDSDGKVVEATFVEGNPDNL